MAGGLWPQSGWMDGWMGCINHEVQQLSAGRADGDGVEAAWIRRLGGWMCAGRLND